MHLKDALSDQEFDVLDGFLQRVIGGRIRNVEALDGFFAALACCPDFVPPREFLEVIQSGAVAFGDLEFQDLDEANAFMSLVMRHWNHVNVVLNSGKPYLPLMMEHDDEPATGNDWARGFMSGMAQRREVWLSVMNDEQEGGALVPILALANEHHDDPALRPFAEALSPERREDLLLAAAAGVMRLFAYFLPERERYISAPSKPARRGKKVGRNDPCPCGSGKKHKRCCGAVTMH
jgi:uncharacterized protein